LPDPSWFSDDIGGQIGSKDAAISLLGKMIVEVSELSAFNGKTAAELKSWLSRQVDRYRPPYGRYAQDFERTNIFAGTINEIVYLDDQTGARRLWPIPCGRIDVEAIERNRDQLWAEAVHRYREGEQWWLAPVFEAEANEAQRERIDVDPWADQVGAWLDEQREVFIRTMGKDGRVTMQRILVDCLGLRVELRNPQVTRRLAGILRDAEWRKWQTPRSKPGVEEDNDWKPARERLYVPPDFEPEMWGNAKKWNHWSGTTRAAGTTTNRFDLDSSGST
jgi:predicted P-loop ATPase